MSDLGRFTETYTTFSGADIVATFNNVAIGTLSGITWSVTREKAPLYTMGSPNPRSFSRGKRGIAGSLIFTMFDRPSLYKMIQDAAANDSSSFTYFSRAHNILPGMNATNELRNRGIVPVEEVETEVQQGTPYYADQIPPFNVTITFANEYGQQAVRNIYGVEMINEGSGASMDDVAIEETMMYVARDLGPMIATKQHTGEGGFDESILDSPDGVLDV